MQRLFVIGVVIAAWFAGGVILEGCRAVELPTGASPNVRVDQTEKPSPTTSASSVTPAQEERAKSVWMWSAARLFQINTQTAMVGERTEEVLSEPASTRNKERQYFVTTLPRAGKWELSLTAMEMSADTPIVSVPLMQVSKTDRNVSEDVIATRPLLTGDEKTAYVAITSHQGANWVTSLMRVNLETARAESPITVFDAAAPWGANVNAAMSPDEKVVYVVRTFDDSQGADSPIKTRVAVVQTASLSVMQVLEVGERIIADSVWSDVIPALNGEDIYLTEMIWNDVGNAAFRFVALGLKDGRPKLTATNVRETLDTGCNARWNFVPNGADLWTWCAAKIQFLDPGTGQISEQLQLQDPLKGSGLAEYALARDGKTVYTIYPMSREIVVADLEKREIVKSVALKDQAIMPNFRRTLEQLLYSTAQAKFGGRPMLALNADETWIAFTEIKSFDSWDGVWVVNVRTLEPIGHWLRGQEISSIRASRDGSELYALNIELDRMQVLNSKSGSIVRAFQVPLMDHAGFLADVQP